MKFFRIDFFSVQSLNLFSSLNLFLILMFSCPWAFSDIQNYRKVRLEWEPVPLATKYEIRLTEKNSRKIISYESTQSAWLGEVQAGHYSFQIRAIDRRGALGPWTIAEDLMVKLSPVQLLTPEQNQEFIHSQQSVEISFSWHKSAAATNYIFKLFDSQGKELFSEITNTPILLKTIPTGGRFRWSVQIKTDNDLTAEIASSYFSVLSTLTTKPRLLMPTNQFVRTISWRTSQESNATQLMIYHFDEKSQTYKIFKEPFETTQTQLDFLQEWDGGQYKVSAVSLKDGKMISQKDEIEFNVISGDRSETAETRFFMDDYLSKESGSFYHLSYIVSSVDYRLESEYFNSETRFRGLMNSLNVGLGYQQNTNWGYRTGLTLNSLSIQGQSLYFADVQAEAYYRRRLGLLSEMRVWAGLKASQSPLVTKSIIHDSIQRNTENVYAVQIGMDFWRALNGTWGSKSQVTYDYGFSGNELIQSSKLKVGAFLTYNQTAQQQYHFGLNYLKNTHEMKPKNSLLKMNLEGFFINLQYERGF